MRSNDNLDSFFGWLAGVMLSPHQLPVPVLANTQTTAAMPSRPRTWVPQQPCSATVMPNPSIPFARSASLPRGPVNALSPEVTDPAG